MKVLGISGRYRDAAAALAVDGRVVAAASEDCFTRVPGIGYTLTGGFPAAAVDACLHSAGLEAGDLDELSIVAEDGAREDDRTTVDQAFNGVPVRPIDAVRADAIQAAAASDSATAVLVCGTDPGSMAFFAKDGGDLTPRGPVAGGDGLLVAARAIARTLGVSAANPYQALDRLSIGGEPEFEADLAPAMSWKPGAGVAIDDSRLSAWLGAVGSRQPGDLAEADSLNVRLQAARRAVAASFTCQLARVVHDAARSVSSGTDLDRVAFGGAMFANLRLSTELRKIAGDELALAAVPELPGRALGAALAATSGAADRLA